MAPQTRRMRVQRATESIDVAEKRGTNSQGFPCLPDDIYYELLSHIPTMPLVRTSEYRNISSKDIWNGHLMLCALSQTCQSLRRFYMPHVWRRIEVFEMMQTPDGPLPPIRRSSVELYAEELVRQLEVVTVRNPELAQYVKILNIVVVNHAQRTVLPELARCISLFPNLRTVKFESRGVFSKLYRPFAKYRYPQIRHFYAVGSEIARGFINSCTGLTHIMSSCEWYMLGLHGIENQPKLEQFGGCFWMNEVQRLAEIMKSVQDISIGPLYLRDRVGFDNIGPLLGLPHLNKIRIRADQQQGWTCYTEVSSDEKRRWIRWARNVLLSGPEMTSVVDGKLKNIVKEVIYVEQNGEQQIYKVSNDQCEEEAQA